MCTTSTLQITSYTNGTQPEAGDISYKKIIILNFEERDKKNSMPKSLAAAIKLPCKPL
jgi:hypothetical protein